MDRPRRGQGSLSRRLRIAACALLPSLSVLLWLGGQRWTALLLWYSTLSILTLLIYARDKHAAGSGRFRTSESLLLGLGLLGGWPGAALAQRWLRHKSSKTSFRAAFAATVFVNLALLALLIATDPALLDTLPVPADWDLIGPR
jgi:uncharacterized membrane protein YsdA (DUF1294 family)